MLSSNAHAQVPLDDLIERADRDALHEDPQWLGLLHYDEGGLLQPPRSGAATPGFFLAEHGNRDARAELVATLRAFFDRNARVKDGEHPQCAFIARRHWLEHRLGLSTAELPRIECPDYERWRAGLDAQGLTLVFPEGFMNSPASMFGHTLLRIDATRAEGSEELLGHAVDFTANTRGDAGLSFIFKGISGLYPGYFLVHPYYERLKRYSDWENRNIWEYRLEVDPADLDFLLMHLWELRAIEFPYYFFTRNCSYELLRLLDIGIPDFDATVRFPGVVIPVDTVRTIVDRPGFVDQTRFRPSPETALRARLRSLSRADRDRVQRIVDGELDPADDALDSLGDDQLGRILDVAYDQLRYEYLARQVSEEDSRGLSRRILIARSRVARPAQGGAPESVELDVPKVRPDQGHQSALLSLAGGWRDDEAFIELRLRPAFHALMDGGGGYPEHMQLRFLDTRMRIHPESGGVRLQELTLFEALSLSPRSRVFEPWAWSLGTGIQTRRVREAGDLDDSTVWRSELGVGLAWDPVSSVLLYGLADARLDVGADLDDKVSFGPGARVGIFAGGRGQRLKGHLFGQVTHFALGDTTTWLRAGAEVRVTTSRNTALVIEGGANRIHGESWLDAVLRLNLYF